MCKFGCRLIDNDIIVTTCKTSISMCNIIDVEAGTNGYHGGDSGHGGRTYIRIEDNSGSDMQVKTVNGDRGVEIFLGGDSELDTIIGALEFAVKILKKQASASKKDIAIK